MTFVNRLPEEREPHVPMFMGMVFARLQERLAVDAPELRPSRVRVLECLPAGGLTISELGQRSGMTTQGCGQFVRQLAGSGMVEVGPDPRDRRAKRVEITDQGRERLARAHAVLASCEEEWAQAVGAERYRTFREVLAEVALG